MAAIAGQGGAVERFWIIDEYWAHCSWRTPDRPFGRPPGLEEVRWLRERVRETGGVTPPVAVKRVNLKMRSEASRVPETRGDDPDFGFEAELWSPGGGSLGANPPLYEFRQRSRCKSSRVHGRAAAGGDSPKKASVSKRRPLRERPAQKAKRAREQSLLDMTNTEARAFLLKPDSYCNIQLPSYLQFGALLEAVRKFLNRTPLSGIKRDKPRDHDKVNYEILSNKDGRHAWRPLQLIHPALYVSLVTQITEKEHWCSIRERFAEFAKIETIKCLSIPVKSLSRQKNKAAQITRWWMGIEQSSIELALDYEHVLHADITDCYAAIYTHSIAWALHGLDVAKEKRRDETLIGNIIDRHIQDMRHGQTNGIPQGSVLMDFVSEMVLGYADLQLSSRLKANGVDGYLILRYRDDYRVFVNNTRTGEVILKSLTEVMIGLGLKLNASKTGTAQSVVSGSLKADKRAWITRRQGDRNLQKHLLVIHAHGLEFPNGGSLTAALSAFHERLSRTKSVHNPPVLISIAVDIAYTSPRAFPLCAAIISMLLSFLPTDDEKRSTIRKIHKKLSQLPNAGHMEVWLQRISHPIDGSVPYNEGLCQLIAGKHVALWNSDWISSADLKSALDPTSIVAVKKLRSLSPVVRPAEVRVFAHEGY